MKDTWNKQSCLIHRARSMITNACCCIPLGFCSCLLHSKNLLIQKNIGRFEEKIWNNNLWMWEEELSRESLRTSGQCWRTTQGCAIISKWHQWALLAIVSSCFQLLGSRCEIVRKCNLAKTGGLPSKVKRGKGTEGVCKGVIKFKNHEC